MNQCSSSKVAVAVQAVPPGTPDATSTAAVHVNWFSNDDMELSSLNEWWLNVMTNVKKVECHSMKMCCYQASS